MIPGEADTYTWPADEVRTPANDSSFGLSWMGNAHEHGGAVDGDGETARHSGGRSGPGVPPLPALSPSSRTPLEVASRPPERRLRAAPPAMTRTEVEG